MNTINVTALVDALLDSPVQESADDLFLSRIQRQDIDIIAEQGYSVEDANVTVKWRADTEYRSWGIKSIDPIVEGISGWITLLRSDTEEDITSTIQLEEQGFTVDGKFEGGVRDERTGLSLWPLSVEINLRNRTALVKF